MSDILSAKDRKNSEGYSDPTVYAAMKNIARDEDRFRKLRKVILNICDELRVLTKRVRQMKAQQPSGIIIMAGEAAHATIRHTFPEDTETVKIKPCRYLKPDQCLIIENRPFPIGKGFQ